jgi:tRNA G18 (ribose-2'-O)-methylase SpoU
MFPATGRMRPASVIALAVSAILPSGMPVHTVDSLDDPRLAPYRNVKDKELARTGDCFMAEGEQVVRRLLSSGLDVASILLTARKADALLPLIPESTDVWLAPHRVVGEILGFEFHSGVMAVGVRPQSPALDELLAADKPVITLVVAQQITNTENIGSLIRIAAAFGADAMLLGERCCDPYYRQSVRVSMGAVFRLPILRSLDLASDLRRLRDRLRFDVIAAVIAPDATPLVAAGRRARIAIVFGSEADGLDPQTLAECNQRVTIPMRRGADSLNVSIAAGIFLYHYVDVCEQLSGESLSAESGPEELPPEAPSTEISPSEDATES